LSNILGGATLALASLLLLLILISAFIPLLLAWCVVEFFYWLLRTRPTAQQLNAQPPEGHCPAMADTDDGLDAFRRFVKVRVARKMPAIGSSRGMQWKTCDLAHELGKHIPPWKASMTSLVSGPAQVHILSWS
jgi:hypothetical protein